MPLHLKLLLYINLKIDFMLKRLVNNTLKDLWTTALGALAGGPDIIQGIIEHDKSKIIKGISILFLGFLTNSKVTKN